MEFLESSPVSHSRDDGVSYKESSLEIDTRISRSQLWRVEMETWISGVVSVSHSKGDRN